MYKIIFFLFNIISQKKIPKIKLNLTYKKINENLTHSFHFFYGNKLTGLKQIESQIDLYYDKSILISNSVNKSGIECSKKNNCHQSEKSHFIINNNQQVIETTLAYIPIYINKNDLKSNKNKIIKNFIKKNHLQFEMVNSNYKVISKNLIGLNYESNFLYYIDKVYNMNGVWFSIKTENQILNKMELLDNLQDLKISLNFFENLDNMFSESYYYQKSECLCLKNFSIDFSGILMNELSGKIDINLPALMKVDSDVYSNFIKEIKGFICKNVGECFKKEHVFPGYDLYQRLNVVFKSKDKDIKNMVIKIFVREMFYYDKDDFIQYNFEMNERKNSNGIIFGILFLQKIDLLIYKGNLDKRNFIIFVNRKGKIKKHYIIEILILSFFGAILMTFLFLKISKPKDDRFGRQSFNSFLY